MKVKVYIGRIAPNVAAAGIIRPGLRILSSQEKIEMQQYISLKTMNKHIPVHLKKVHWQNLLHSYFLAHLVLSPL